MREIVHIQCGECGNNVGSSFWKAMIEEHGLDNTGEYHGQSEVQQRQLPLYFREVAQNRYSPRAILVDLDPRSVDAVRTGHLGKLFSPGAEVVGKCGTGNNWAKGFYTLGEALLDPFADVLRRECEACDYMPCFQVVHSLGGGTGSGLGCQLLWTIRELNGPSTICSYPVLNSPVYSDALMGVYNMTLSMFKLQDLTDIAVVFDNQALYNICFSNLGIVAPTYRDLNNVIVSALSGLTCSMRFPGVLNSDLRKMAVNLIPFPRMHFLLSSVAPLLRPETPLQPHYSVHDLIEQAFDEKNVMCMANTKISQYATAFAMCRGVYSMQEIEEEMRQFTNRHSKNFVNWIPDNVKAGVCPVPQPGYERHLTLLGNTSAIRPCLDRILDRFEEMFKRKAFLHRFLDEGMDSMEIMDAENYMRDVSSEYNLFDIYNTAADPE